MGTTDKRIFLGLHRPPLHSAVDWIIDNCQSSCVDRTELDLSQYIIVTPTQRSRQRLLQLLVQQTDESELLFTPPVITSLGNLPEYLYVAEKALATDLAQQIAWSIALEATPEDELAILTGQSDPEELQDWQPLASLISNLHTRLANDIWSFRSVAREVKKDKRFIKAESKRWEVLNNLQDRYYRDVLKKVDLWDRQAARNYAAAGLLKADPPEIRCETDKKVIMLCAADLNRSISEMLHQLVKTDPEKVKILIAAEEQDRDRFDEFGSLITEQWISRSISIPDEKIVVVDQPADQANAAAIYISNLDQDVAADQITIGVPDESIIPQLERSIHAIGLEHRNLAGRRLSETAPVRLMMACRNYLHNPTYESLASLVRHPDMFRFLSEHAQSNSWLNQLAATQRESLAQTIGVDDDHPFGDPDKIKQDFDPVDPGSEKRAAIRAQTAAVLNSIHHQLSKLLKPLDAEARPLAEWSDSWSDILLAVYGDRRLSKSNLDDLQIIRACDAIHTALGDQRQVPKSFETVTTSIQALDWALEAANEKRVIPPPIPSAVEFAGWLDLALDDAEVVVVTGMNDEHVPSSEIGHQFLPNELCKQLGILDNDRRYARDCYALNVITKVRQNYQLIAGRRDDLGEPLKPSRLLFANDPATAALRAKAFFSYSGKINTRFWLDDVRQCQPHQQFTIPRPMDPSPVNQLSVTKFREYIKCPYRFYLQHVLKLDEVSDDWRELDGGRFGDLTHNVLESFGRSDCRLSSEAAEIFAFLDAQLEAFTVKLFGGSHLPAVRIQIEQLRLRLERFAEQQADWCRAGWKIVSTEEMLEHDFEVDGKPFRIRGKIDRVDQHQQTGQVAVWDYKSSDKGDPPDTVHYSRRDKTWRDLQLPLYRHLVKEVAAVADADLSNVIMGYILLPKKLDEIRFHEAEWDAAQLESADETAKAIIRKLRKSEFWPPNPRPPKYSEPLAAICQDQVFEQYDVEQELQEESPW